MNLLLVDDNPDITDLLSKFLKSRGHHNIVTNDSRDGLKKIMEESYDFIFLDIHMPYLSGLDVIRTLESKNMLKDQKIVIFSAHNFTEPEIQDLLDKEGIVAHLKKPIQLNVLLTAMTA